MKKIKPENLETAINEILEDYRDRIVDGSKESVDAAGQMTLKVAKAYASRIGSGKYANSLTLSHDEDTGRVYMGAHVTIYSKKYRIAHLLEHGHVVKAHGKVVGTARAYPHFAPAEEAGTRILMEKIRRII